MRTIGLWTCDPETGVVYSGDGKAIQTGGAGCDEETRGNGYLIAAAPGLLQATQMLLLLVQGGPGSEYLDKENVKKAAKEAVEKAFEPGKHFFCSKCGYSGLVQYPHPRHDSPVLCRYEAH